MNRHSETKISQLMDFHRVSYENPGWKKLRGGLLGEGPQVIVAVDAGVMTVVPKDADSVIAFANYSFDFAAAISCGFVHGVQFHPEKSSLKGELMLDGFVNL